MSHVNIFSKNNRHALWIVIITKNQFAISYHHFTGFALCEFRWMGETLLQVALSDEIIQWTPCDVINSANSCWMTSYKVQKFVSFFVLIKYKIFPRSVHKLFLFLWFVTTQQLKAIKIFSFFLSREHSNG